MVWLSRSRNCDSGLAAWFMVKVLALIWRARLAGFISAAQMIAFILAHARFQGKLDADLEVLITSYF